MANKTPSQLDTLSQHGETLSDQSIFIVQQGAVVGKVTFGELVDTIMPVLETFVTDTIANDYIAVQASIDSLTTSIANKAASNHTHTKADIGLSNVANTAPLDLPISTAVQDALDLKANLDAVVGETLLVAGTGPQW